MTEQTNGSTVDQKHSSCSHSDETLHGVLHRLISMIIFPDTLSTPLLQRIKISVSENAPRLGDASRNTTQSLLDWTRRGSPLRALLVISVGTIALLTLTGMLVFMLFFLAATVNAIIISLLITVAAAGGFLALFFVCVTAIYIGALSVATFVISTATLSAIVAVLVATGWVGFFWAVWLGTKKSLGLAKHSLSMTGSVLSAYSPGRHARRHQERDGDSD